MSLFSSKVCGKDVQDKEAHVWADGGPAVVASKEISIRGVWGVQGGRKASSGEAIQTECSPHMGYGLSETEERGSGARGRGGGD